jgi:gluconate kinase
MGVSGTGKTSLGKILQKINIPFYDADDFHSKEILLNEKIGVII